MRYADLMQLYYERSNALQWYWTLYVVIIGGLLAFSSLRQRRDVVTEILITVLFCFFAYKNLGAIHDVTLQRLGAMQSIVGFPTVGEVPEAVRTRLEAALVSPDFEGTWNFHVTCDVLTVAALWAMEWRRWRIARREAASGR